MKMIYLLLAGWEVRIGKNCDLGLENAARGRRPITCLSYFPAVNWLTRAAYESVCLRNFVIELAYAPSTRC